MTRRLSAPPTLAPLFEDEDEDEDEEPADEHMPDEDHPIFLENEALLQTMIRGHRLIVSDSDEESIISSENEMGQVRLIDP